MQPSHLLCPLRFAVCLVAFLACAACGGGGYSGGGESTYTFAPTTDTALYTNSAVGGPGLQVGESPVIGFNSVSGIRFPLLPFLDNTDTVISAKLRVRQISVTGTPYPTHGNIVVDLVNFGASLGAGDHAAPVVTPAIGTLSTDATLGFKEIDVTAQVAAAVATNDFVIDFLLRFNAVVSAGAADFASFENQAGTLGTPDGPELVVTYRPGP